MKRGSGSKAGRERRAASAVRVMCIAARCLAGLSLGAAALPKAAAPAALAAAIRSYGLLPAALANPAAIVLPWVELACAAALLAGRRYRAAGALTACALFASFALAALAARAGPGAQPCGCFGPAYSLQAGSAQHLAVNLVLGAAALLAYACAAGRVTAVRPTQSG